MKIRILIVLCMFAAVVLMGVLLNREVTTRQGIDYCWRTRTIPLYLKLIDFYSRHFNYQYLAGGICARAGSAQEKVLAVLNWSHANIRHTPPGFPVVDDHVWNIIIRGYGEDDQINDVFCVLCNYAGGLRAFMAPVASAVRPDRRIILSFVRMNGQWTAVDACRGVYFVNTDGGLATLDEMKKGQWMIRNVVSVPALREEYEEYIAGLPETGDVRLTRQTLQSPLNRFLFWLGRDKEGGILP